MSTQIYENEKLSFERMMKRAREEGKITGATGFNMHSAKDIKHNKREQQSQDGTVVVREIRTKDGKTILFAEGQETAEFMYIYGEGDRLERP